ncbi:DUF2267 domain-containing protein [Rhizobium terrae]|uniref:DUF2267 domain-containing protein n=1 Tax=Rhizobium terrae TaxID=2171756 RepID=UPI0013C2DD6F|nr:DUF2267 domain-containing protein [Rhizobium terrae]
MTVPMEYRQASRDFDAFMLDARDGAMLQTTNQTYTMVEAVFTVFRRRLSVPDALLFAEVLPPVLRAIFVSHWDVDEPVRPFDERTAMIREVKAFRGYHNVSPDDSIAVVASALRRHVDAQVFERTLLRLPAGAADFWQADR